MAAKTTLQDVHAELIAKLEEIWQTSAGLEYSQAEKSECTGRLRAYRALVKRNEAAYFEKHFGQQGEKKKEPERVQEAGGLSQAACENSPGRGKVRKNHPVQVNQTSGEKARC